jgi:hypothetical protein
MSKGGLIHWPTTDVRQEMVSTDRLNRLARAEGKQAGARLPATMDGIQAELEELRKRPEQYAMASARLVYQLNQIPGRPRYAKS